MPTPTPSGPGIHVFPNAASVKTFLIEHGITESVTVTKIAGLPRTYYQVTLTKPSSGNTGQLLNPSETRFYGADAALRNRIHSVLKRTNALVS